MKKYIITGATGHIGNNLIRYIQNNEPTAEITALLRSTTSLLSGTQAEEKLIDFEDDAALSSCIPSDSILIHLAAVIDLSDKKSEEMERVNVELTKRLCRICLKNKAAFIYCGSVDGIYKSGNEIITEPSDYFPEKIEGGYGKTKATAAKYILGVMNENPDFTCSIILPSAVMGINDYKPSEIGRIILDCIKGKPELGMNGGYNFVNVKDVCCAIHSAAVSGKSGQYIVSGENVTVRELYGLINMVIAEKTALLSSRIGLSSCLCRLSACLTL